MKDVKNNEDDAIGKLQCNLNGADKKRKKVGR